MGFRDELGSPLPQFLFIIWTVRELEDATFSVCSAVRMALKALG